MAALTRTGGVGEMLLWELGFISGPDGCKQAVAPTARRQTAATRFRFDTVLSGRHLLFRLLDGPLPTFP